MGNSISQFHVSKTEEWRSNQNTPLETLNTEIVKNWIYVMSSLRRFSRRVEIPLGKWHFLVNFRLRSHLNSIVQLQVSLDDPYDVVYYKNFSQKRSRSRVVQRNVQKHEIKFHREIVNFAIKLVPRLVLNDLILLKDALYNPYGVIHRENCVTNWSKKTRQGNPFRIGSGIK